MKPAYGLTVRGVIKNSDDEILIVKRHPKSRTDPEMWELPGGKVEKKEHFADALVREIKEETNLDCEVGTSVKLFKTIICTKEPCSLLCILMMSQVM